MSWFRTNVNRLKIVWSAIALKRSRPSLAAYADSVFDEHWKLFKPLQIRSEFESLLEIVQNLAPRHSMEIGTANGGTLYLFARTAPEDARFISVDLPHGEFGGGYSPIRKPVYRSFARKQQEVHLLRADSHDPGTVTRVEELLAGERLDFLFVDGDHSYEGVKRDFELYSPLVRKGGVIAFHDIAEHPPSHGCEVDRFWNELKQRFRHMEFVENPRQGWAGIGVLFL